MPTIPINNPSLSPSSRGLAPNTHANPPAPDIVVTRQSQTHAQFRAPGRPPQRFLAPKGRPIPGRIHTRADNITQYHALGARGWEANHRRRGFEAEAKVGQIGSTWAANGGGVIRDFREERVEWVRRVLEEAERERAQGDVQGKVGEHDDVQGGDERESTEHRGVVGGDAKGKEEKEKEQEKEPIDESGWSEWTETEKFLARKGIRKRRKREKEKAATSCDESKSKSESPVVT